MAKSKANTNQTQTKAPADTKETKCDPALGAEHGHTRGIGSTATATKGTLSPNALAELENELNNREIAIIEREIKSLRLQEEVDRLRPLSGLYRVVKAMATERRLDSLLDTITRETQSIVKCDRCSVFVLDHDKNELWTQVAQGLTGVRTIRIPLAGTAIVSYCARAGRIINIPDAYKDDRFDPAVDRKTGYKTKSVLNVPMRNREGGIIGVFQVLNKLSGPFTSEDEEWLEALTAVASGLIEQAQAYDEIERFVDKTLEVLAQTIDKRDPLTAGHSVRVTNYSMMIGTAMDVLGEDLDILRYSAMMHDYGKIGVPEAVLWKPGRLTPEEYATVQKHASITFDLLSNLPFTRRLQAVPFVASCHHEKLDGTGYYRGLKGEQIPFLSRIIAVADVFDALTSVRHYRNRMPIEKVAEILDAGRDNHFDAACVEAFDKLPAGTVLTCMESERDRNASADIGMFGQITWKRLVELTSGSKPKRGEENLKESFERLYNFGLPADYKPLD